MSETDDDFKIYEETENANLNSTEDSLSPNEEIASEDLSETDTKNSGFLLNMKKKEKKEKKEIVNRRTPDSVSSARMVVIDFLEGTTKKSEAISYARGFIDNHYSSPQSCYIYVEPYENSYAVEIHDGGDNRPYLPNVLKSLEEDPLSCICIQNRRRVLEIKRNDKGIISSILLPEGIDSTETNIVRAYPSENDKMIPYAFNSLSISLFGITFGLISFLFLLLTSIICLFLYERPIKVIPVTAVEELPIKNWDSLMKKYSNEAYIEKLSYDGKTWNISSKIISMEGKKRDLPSLGKHKPNIPNENIGKEEPNELNNNLNSTEEDISTKHEKDENIVSEEKTDIEPAKNIIEKNIETKEEEFEEMPPLEEANEMEEIPSIETFNIIQEKDEILNPAEIEDPIEREKAIREKMSQIRGINSEN